MLPKDIFNWRATLTQPATLSLRRTDLQHAEHYFRLMAAAQAEQLEGQPATFGPQDNPTPEDFADSDDFGGLPDRFASPAQQARQAFSNQTDGAAPLTPQPYAQRKRWVVRKAAIDSLGCVTVS